MFSIKKAASALVLIASATFYSACEVNSTGGGVYVPPTNYATTEYELFADLRSDYDTSINQFNAFGVSSLVGDFDYFLDLQLCTRFPGDPTCYDGGEWILLERSLETTDSAGIWNVIENNPSFNCCVTFDTFANACLAYAPCLFDRQIYSDDFYATRALVGIDVLVEDVWGGYDPAYRTYEGHNRENIVATAVTTSSFFSAKQSDVFYTDIDAFGVATGGLTAAGNPVAETKPVTRAIVKHGAKGNQLVKFKTRQKPTLITDETKLTAEQAAMLKKARDAVKALPAGNHLN